MNQNDFPQYSDKLDTNVNRAESPLKIHQQLRLIIPWKGLEQGTYKKQVGQYNSYSPL